MQSNKSLFFRFFLAGICMFLLSLPVAAQSYADMWKSVRQSQRRDLPKTALLHLDKIVDRALQRGDGGQLIAALLVRQQVAADISPDSARVIPVMEGLLAGETRKPIQALYHVALGALYEGEDSHLNENVPEQVAAHYRAAMAHPEDLAQARMTDYLPFVVSGSDSRLFSDDLLHLVAKQAASGLLRGVRTKENLRQEAAQIYAEAIQCYRASGNRDAMLLMQLDSIDAVRPAYYLSSAQMEQFSKDYENLISRYADSRVAVEIYIRLSSLYADRGDERNAYRWASEGWQKYEHSKRAVVLKNRMMQIERPTLSLNFNGNQSFPGQNDSITITARNLTKAVMKFYRTDLTAEKLFNQPMPEDKIKSYLKEVVMTVPINLRKGEPYESVSLRMPFTAPKPGVYYAVCEGEGLRSDYCAYFVSSLHAMVLPLDAQTTRVVVSDAQSGRPVEGVTVTVRSSEQNNRTVATLRTDAKGEVLLEGAYRKRHHLFVQTAADRYAQSLSFSSFPQESELVSSSSDKIISLYQDRSIYRPGQTVKVAGISYVRKGDQVTVNAGDSLTLRLLDANRKEVSAKKVCTDRMGTLDAEFALPEECLNGVFSITSGKSSLYFRVEQYRRPTFKVEFDDVTTSYAAGETVKLKGRVVTYAGFPLAETRVAVKVMRRPAAFFFDSHALPVEQLSDTLTTLEDGTFEVPVTLNVEPGDEGPAFRHGPCFYVFATEAVATLQGGESATADYSLFAGNRPSYISTTLPQLFCREVLPSFQVNHFNPAGLSLSGNARYEVWQQGECRMKGEWRFHEAVPTAVFSSLPSGEYRLRVVPAERTDTVVMLQQKFTIMSLADTKPAQREPLSLLQSSATFSDRPVEVRVGTALKDAYLHLDVMAGKTLLESRLIPASDTVIHLQYAYQSDYGDGLMLLASLVRDGKVHTRRITIAKPTPEKQLSLQWQSFRDHLRPGQTEDWTLRILRGGRPVEASLMATLYDASLDRFRKHAWYLNLHFPRIIPFRNWSFRYPYHFELSLLADLRMKNEPEWDFGRLDVPGFAVTDFGQLRVVSGLKESKVMRLSSAKPVMARAGMAKMADQAVVTTAANDEEEAVLSEAVPQVEAAEKVRSDFSETAFFVPRLMTDEEGFVKVAFTLPQSLTQWNFKALAHTREMDYGLLEATVTASKDFMVQPNMPRFLRSGDSTSLAVAVRSLAADTVSGRLTVEWTDAATGKVCQREAKSFSVAPQKEQTLLFPMAVNGDYPLLICKVVAVGDGFSDGEQHYVPVISDLQELTESLPLDLEGKGEKQTDLTPLFQNASPRAQQKTLTVEYTARPAWLALEALPSLSRTDNGSSLSLATSYYALSLAQLEVRSHPEIARLAQTWKQAAGADSLFLMLERNEDLKQVVLAETPWVAAADRERERLQQLASLFDTVSLSYRRQSGFDRLMSLQQADGSWSLFKGMSGSLWTTIEVTRLLARLQKLGLTDKNTSRCQASLKRADRFMAREMGGLVKQLKKQEQETRRTPLITGLCLNYLHLCALCSLPATADTDYLTRLLVKGAPQLNMYEKSLAVGVLTAAGREKEAREVLRSLMEHTVEQPALGRYFDTKRAPMSSSYRIPTQVATLDALYELTPSDTATIRAMTRWLLQSKRTQSWGDCRSSVDAVYHLFVRSGLLQADEQCLKPSIRLEWKRGKATDLTPVADQWQEAATLGYYRRTLSEADMPSAPQKLRLTKAGASTAFGAVHASYLLPASEVKPAEAGLEVKAVYSVKRSGRWQPVTTATVLRRGDLVKVRYEIRAERDFDFVSLKEGRPACMEPLEALSGYDYRSDCYREVGEASSHYFFERMAKGLHVVETEMRADRQGSFSSSAPLVQCVYAPEFSGRGEAVTLRVE